MDCDQTTSSQSASTLSSSSDDEENSLYFRKREWGWPKDSCFICHKKGMRRRRHSSRGHVFGTKSNVWTSKRSTKSDNELRKCSAPSCPILFHEQCFLDFTEGDFLPEMHVLDSLGEPCFDPAAEGKKWYCPQHECNACHQELLRNRSQLGTLISCVRCVFAWHRSCVIVGSHYVNRFLDKYLLCPRHNNLPKISRIHMSYCVGCELPFRGSKTNCCTCVRSFCDECWRKDVKKEKVTRAPEDKTEQLICGYCMCADYPRIGDYVLAVDIDKLYPAKAVHADQIPLCLRNNSSLIEKLEEEGYVLVQWVEGIKVPNYSVISYRDIVAIPKSFECSFWKTIKEAKALNAVKKLYANGKMVSGMERPLPIEVTELKVPGYKHIDVNVNGKAARALDVVDYCYCPVDKDGLRCTTRQCCINRVAATECPEDCDEAYRRWLKSRNVDRYATSAKRLSVETIGGKCVNNFLRNHRREQDEEFLEERTTAHKGFGVFAKKCVPEGSSVTEYLGVVMPREDYLERTRLRASHNNLEMSYFGIQLAQWYLDGRNYGGFGRTMNHSCDPNCQVSLVSVDGVYRLKMSSIKDIFVGDELTFDYGSEIIEGLVGTKCLCGSKNCRGSIGKKQTTDTRKCASKKAVLLEKTCVGNVGSSQATRPAKRLHPADSDVGEEENKAPKSLSTRKSFKQFTVRRCPAKRKKVYG